MVEIILFDAEGVLFSSENLKEVIGFATILEKESIKYYVETAIVCSYCGQRNCNGNCDGDIEYLVHRS